MRDRITLVFAVLFISANLFGQTVVKKVKPIDTDPLITTFNLDSNYVYLNTTTTAKNILVIHLPGSYGEPKMATLFGTLASDLGYHSIGLMYPNIPTVASICSNSSDPSCFENVRREIIEGVDYSSGIAINSTECILNRAKKLLVYLRAHYASENWGQYLDVNDDLIYSKIIFSGHSQGGGHAAVIGKYFATKRIICFSSPKDYSNYFMAPPLWYSTGIWQTSKANICAFNHTLDNYSEQLEILDSLGIDNYGLPINVDNNVSPYNYTRQLTTTYAVASGDEHASTVQDNKTPKVSGTPVFIPVWTYMLTDDLTTGFSNDLVGDKSNLKLAPNPTNEFVNLELPDENYLIKVYDQTGKCVIEQNSVNRKIQINLTALNSGLYYIKATSDKNMLSGKVVKQ